MFSPDENIIGGEFWGHFKDWKRISHRDKCSTFPQMYAEPQNKSEIG